MDRIAQCQFTGERNVLFLGRTVKELKRCQERETEPGQFWRDPEFGLDDPYCPRHERMIKRRAEAREAREARMIKRRAERRTN